MQLYLRYEGEKPELTTALKITVPKKWLDKGTKCSKVLAMFIDAFNAKHKQSFQASDLSLWGDTSKKEIDLSKSIQDELAGEETVWVKHKEHKTEIRATSKALTEYVPRLLAKKEDLESLRAKSQQVLCGRATEVLAAFAIPSDEGKVVAVRRVSDERTGEERMIIKCELRVYEVHTIQCESIEYADALARIWTQLGSLVRYRRNILVGPYIPARFEHGKCVAKVLGEHWLCTPHYKKIQIENTQDNAKLIGTLLGRLHSVVRHNSIHQVAEKGVTLKPRSWQEKVSPKHVETQDLLLALDIKAYQLEIIFQELPLIWNHSDFGYHSIAIASNASKTDKEDRVELLMTSATTQQSKEAKDDDEEETVEGTKSKRRRNEPLYVIEHCANGLPRPRLVELLSLFQLQKASFSSFRELGGLSMQRQQKLAVKMQTLEIALKAYAEASEWQFTPTELRVVTAVWKLHAREDPELLADIFAVEDEIIRAFHEANLKFVPSTDPPPVDTPFKLDEEAPTDTESEGEDLLDGLMEREPTMRGRFLYMIKHGLDNKPYDRLEKKLRKKFKTTTFVDFFQDEYHGSGIREPDDPTPKPLDMDAPMVLSSELYIGDIRAPRPFMYGHKKPTTVWRVAACVILLIRDRDRQANVWDNILYELPDALIIKAIDAYKVRQFNAALKRNDPEVFALPDLHAWPTLLNRGHVAQALSHRIAWRKFLAEAPMDHCVFLEDDAIVEGAFRGILAETLSRIDDKLPDIRDSYDLIYLHVPVDNRRMDSEVELIPDLFDAHYDVPSSCGYMLSKRGATKLLDLTKRLDRPLKLLLTHLAAIGHIKSYIIRNLDLCGDGGTHPTDMHEIQRQWAGIKLLSNIVHAPPFAPDMDFDSMSLPAQPPKPVPTPTEGEEQSKSEDHPPAVAEPIVTYKSSVVAAATLPVRESKHGIILEDEDYEDDGILIDDSDPK